MSDEKASDETVTVDDISLSPPEAAVLELTSDIRETKNPGEISYLTSKSAYVWAGLAVALAQVNKKYSSIERRIDIPSDFDIHKKIYEGLASYVNRPGPELEWAAGPDKPPPPRSPEPPVRSYSSEVPLLFPTSSGELPQLTAEGLPQLTSGDLPQPGVPFTIHAPEPDIRTVSNIIESFLKTFVPQSIDYSILLSDINSSIDDGYRYLVRAGLITDPVIEATLALAILGLFPFSIVKRTNKGQVVYRKFQAALWKYEHDKRAGGVIETNLTFEAARIAKALKVGLISAYNEATKGPGEPPVE